MKTYTYTENLLAFFQKTTGVILVTPICLDEDSNDEYLESLRYLEDFFEFPTITNCGFESKMMGVKIVKSSNRIKALAVMKGVSWTVLQKSNIEKVISWATELRRDRLSKKDHLQANAVVYSTLDEELLAVVRFGEMYYANGVGSTFTIVFNDPLFEI